MPYSAIFKPFETPFNPFNRVNSRPKFVILGWLKWGVIFEEYFLKE